VPRGRTGGPGRRVFGKVPVPRLARTAPGRAGILILAFVCGVAIAGPLIAPHSVTDTVGLPGQGPSAGAWLGTDFLGRDVLSRLLAGGISVLWLSTLSTFCAYVVGIGVGLTAGYSRTLADPLLMRFVDLILAFPAVLFLLVLVAAAGTSAAILLVGVVIVLFPGIARVVRTATMEASVRGYVEAAVLRGEAGRVIALREILPNILPFVVADFGVRFSAAIIFVASLNFLGLGLQPPAANWGLMVSENREVITTNIWAVAAPAIMLGLLTVGVNLVGDGYSRALGQSELRA
jgi:peptide/nickel transport system permease protein